MRNFIFQTDGLYHIYNRGVDKRNVFCEQGDYARFIKTMVEFNNKSTDTQRDYEKRILKEKMIEEKNKGLTAANKTFNVGYPTLNVNTAEYPTLNVNAATLNVNKQFEFLKMPKLVDIICYSLLPNHFHFILKQLKENGIAKFMQKLGNGYTKYFNRKNKRSGSLFEGTYQAIEVEKDEYLLTLSCYIHGNPEIHKIAKAENWPWGSFQDYLGVRDGKMCNKNFILSMVDYDIEEYKEITQNVIYDSSERKKAMKEYMLE